MPTPTPISENYFADKTIEVVIGYSPGGFFDFYSQVLGDAARRLLQGNPGVTYNYILGHSGLLALQYTMGARPDGLTIHAMNNQHVAEQVAGISRPGIDVNSIDLLGSLYVDQSSAAFCIQRTVAEKWDDVLTLGKRVTFGTTRMGTRTMGAKLAETLGGPVRIIQGYGNSSEILDAIDVYEIDAALCDPTRIDSEYSNWYDERRLVPLFYWRSPVSQSFLDKMAPGLRSNDVPHAFDLLNPSGEQQTAFLLAQDLHAMNGMFVLPPGTPQDVVQAWRRLIRDAANDPQTHRYAADLVAESGFTSRRIVYGDPNILRASIDSGSGFSTAACNLFLDIYGRFPLNDAGSC